MISHKLKFIFIHIPKTAGTSLMFFFKDVIDNKVNHGDLPAFRASNVICEVENNNIKHKDITYYNELYGIKIKDYFSFKSRF